jgi:hypothetical protein
MAPEKPPLAFALVRVTLALLPERAIAAATLLLPIPELAKTVVPVAAAIVLALVPAPLKLPMLSVPLSRATPAVYALLFRAAERAGVGGADVVVAN